MWMSNTLTTIDIWSSKIRTIIWYFDQENENDFNILGVWISDSTAIRKWNILDMEEFKKNLNDSLEEAEKMAWEQVSWAYISFNSSSFEVIRNRWIISISGTEVSEDDIDRALDKARSWVDIVNKEVLKLLPETFVVDLEDWIKNPLWMSAKKIEVTANIFSMSSNVLLNIKKAINDIWVEIYDIYPNLLASPEWVLTKRQKELGVVCLDIWSSTTWITVFENWVLIFSSIIPIGWDNVTNDIALGLRTSTRLAEKVKLDYAELDLENKEWFRDSEFELSELNMWEEWKISREYLSKIVTARYEELFDYIRVELKKAWKDWLLPEWAVCVWGWSKMKWFVRVAKKWLKLPVFIWLPVSKDDLVDSSISDPVFSSVIWTMILSNLYNSNTPMFSINLSWFLDTLKKIFWKIIPK